MRLLAALAALALLGCGKPPAEPPAPYTIADGKVVFAPDAKMLSRLEILDVGKASEESKAFRSVGQMIALSNRSENLTGEGVGWVELDSQLTASVELHLDDGLPAGTAYGLTNLPPEYRERVQVGHRVEVQRYGLKRSSVSATIVKVLPRPGDGIDVVFRFSQAQDWFPGTNTEVSFPLLTGHPVRIPTTAPIHAGAQEYVWKEVAPRTFSAQPIGLIDATPAEVSVLGLNPGDRVIGRGAILLRPLLDALLSQRKN